jgi:hypothetical protein
VVQTALAVGFKGTWHYQVVKPDQPHPMGHRLPAFDDGLPAKVKRRGALWRGFGAVLPS